jgi:hypothetical protein
MKIACASMRLFIPLGLIALAVAGRAAAQAPGDTTYRPGLGDLMTMTIQPRHIKLGLAGRAGNWTYAAYELHELQEAFDRAMGVWPVWQSVPVGEMERAVMHDPFDALDQAIKAGDAARFTAAYKSLTDACDACHQAADRAFVVIRVPDQDFFPDQDFQPAKKQ